MFVHSRNYNIKMNKDFHWKIKSSIETTLLWICTGHNLVKFYNVDYPHCNWKCTMSNWLFTMSMRCQTSFFRHRTRKSQMSTWCRTDSKKYQVMHCCIWIITRFFENIFKKLFINHSNSLAFDSFNF